MLFRPCRLKTTRSIILCPKKAYETETLQKLDTMLVTENKHGTSSAGANRPLFEGNGSTESSSHSLLPGTLEGAKVTVNFVDEKNPASKEYLLADEDKTPITIKKNVRTTVLFNGLRPDEFEVRYAGFDDGNDAVIDVSGGDKDEWNGVN